jgi:DNA-binding transcriptional regulator GbsR (MarR family)
MPLLLRSAAPGVVESAPPPVTGLVRAADRDPAQVAFDERMVGFFLEAAELFSVPKSVAAIYGICFASAEPLSFADLGARLELSQGSISQGLRFLREIGALKVVEVEARVGEEGGPAGRRREHFEPDLELRKLARRWLEQRLARQLQSGRTRLQAVRQALPATDPADAKRLKARVKSLETWHGKGRALVPVMKTFLQLT